MGELFGMAFYGKNGNKKASIASLYLNILQLRICEIVAIGQKEKSKDQHPEIATLEDNKLIIKPYLLNKNF